MNGDEWVSYMGYAFLVVDVFDYEKEFFKIECISQDFGEGIVILNVWGFYNDNKNLLSVIFDKTHLSKKSYEKLKITL